MMMMMIEIMMMMIMIEIIFSFLIYLNELIALLKCGNLKVREPNGQCGGIPHQS